MFTFFFKLCSTCQFLQCSFSITYDNLFSFKQLFYKFYYLFLSNIFANLSLTIDWMLSNGEMRLWVLGLLINLLFYQLAVLSNVIFFKMPFFNMPLLQRTFFKCQFANMPFIQNAILPTCHLFKMLFYQCAIFLFMLCCQFVIKLYIHNSILSTCHFFKLIVWCFLFDDKMVS